MIADLKPYAEYKESGLAWLGQMPGHWSLVPNRGLVRKRKVLVGNRHGDYRLLSLTKQGVIVRDISTGKGKFSSDMGTSQEVRSGDLVFCLFDVPETPRTVGLSQHDGMITGAYTVFESLGRGSAEYFELFYRAMDERKLLSPLYSGLRNTIPPERFLGTKSPLPPPAEQAAIVRFLDWANGRLERAIRAKRKVIALLGEQKQAIINRAVTRGLDPSVPLKRSGIPWLGDIPQHWNCVPIKRLLSRMDYGTSEASTEAGSVRVLTMGNIQKGEVVMPRSGGLDDVPDALLLHRHDLLFTRTNGNPELVGKVGIFRGEVSDRVSFASYLVRLRVRGAYEAQWLHLLLNSSAFWPFARSHALVNLQTNLNSTRYGQFLVPVPPRAEQAQLVGWIADKSNVPNSAISRLEREIELLREYRTRLVADVVTGKLDVRHAALHLPDEAPPDTVEDDADLNRDPDAVDEEPIA